VVVAEKVKACPGSSVFSGSEWTRSRPPEKKAAAGGVGVRSVTGKSRLGEPKPEFLRAINEGRVTADKDSSSKREERRRGGGLGLRKGFVGSRHEKGKRTISLSLHQIGVIIRKGGTYSGSMSGYTWGL